MTESYQGPLISLSYSATSFIVCCVLAIRGRGDMFRVQCFQEYKNIFIFAKRPNAFSLNLKQDDEFMEDRHSILCVVGGVGNFPSIFFQDAREQTRFFRC